MCDKKLNARAVAAVAVAHYFRFFSAFVSAGVESERGREFVFFLEGGGGGGAGRNVAK